LCAVEVASRSAEIVADTGIFLLMVWKYAEFAGFGVSSHTGNLGLAVVPISHVGQEFRVASLT
jgi:hypothetical protein